MRKDFSCFRDGAVTTLAVAEPGSSADRLDRSLQAATACVYRVALASRKDLLVTVTWTRRSVVTTSVADAAAAGATGLSVAVEEVQAEASTKPTLPPSSAVATPRRAAVKPAAAATAQQRVVHLMHKRRGTRSFVTEGGTAVAVHWDTSEAKYAAASPEPCGGEYHLAVVADAELALLLGSGAAREELSRRFGAASRAALVSRREQLRAPSPSSAEAASVAHSTRCRFRDGGAEHEVTVRCRGDRRGASSRGEHADGEVAVSVDGKSIVEARRVGWNFRGNRTAVLGDGAVVEVMWDVHDWWFAGGVGAAQFMVKARGPGPADGGRVWMDEELASKGQPPAGFFLHMQCYRR
ncbi:hypothetical protein CFC21_060077 [Triticum aestivum]|uniref:Uncharacterized protein n=3 Tax=Triticinae TaxID=1648030 RepID=A0A453H042_AEGTS|nr:uncharacterized protein LOC109777481 [Aegilops tauschii subsp. strangulata]KAF7051887.1 hypothetical protein CFC21_060077 [Triticum aestivum]